MADRTGRRSPRGWRKLGVFWLTVLALAAAGGGVLQWLGPPAGGVPEASRVHGGTVSVRASPVPVDDLGSLLMTAKPVVVAQPTAPPVVSGRDSPGPVADPDPALLEPAVDGSAHSLPRIASDGRKAMQVYAAGYDHSSRRPRIGLLVAGIGLNEAESDAAIRALPGAVSLAISPYARNVTRLLATARALGHEYLISIPLEPVGFPLNDPGPRTLLTSAPLGVNLRNLLWALSRIDGYAGATGVIGTMRGERLAAMTDQMEPVLAELAGRGLFYIDPREGGGPLVKAWGRHAGLVIDAAGESDPADRAAIDMRLGALEQQAKDTGSALGLVMRPTPVAVARIVAWSNGLGDRGLALAPVSALALPPAPEPVTLSAREQ